jgi:hypothetical protein
MKLAKLCEMCKKEYLVRQDKILTSKTCSFICRGKYAGNVGRKKVLDEWAKDTKEQIKQKLKDSYLRFVDIKQGCWGWKGAKKSEKFKYGTLTFRGKEYLSHRLSYYLYFGDIPEKMYVLHKCDNPECSNPEHLFLGTYLDNKRDQIRKGRAKVEKLNEKKVSEIKKMLADKFLHKEISKKYGISATTIWSIQTGRTWNDIKPE